MLKVAFQTPLRASDPRPRVEHVVFRERLLITEKRYGLAMGYTSGYPASSTRNRIVQQFLAGDCDYLVMLDDDQAPTCNVLDYVGQADIIGFPYPSLRINAADPIPWFPAPPTEAGLTEVNTIGGGCMIIKRAVLEAIPRPFEDFFDADGIFTEGEDVSFCRRATERGYKIHCVMNQPLIHIKPAEMLRMWNYVRTNSTV